LVIVAIGHWETLNGHGGTIRPLVAGSGEVSSVSPHLQVGEYVNKFDLCGVAINIFTVLPGKRKAQSL